MKKLDFFEKNGYVIIDIDKKFIKKFRSLKKEIEIESRKFSNFDTKFKLENFHKYRLKKNISLNQFRLKMISKINQIKNLKIDIYESVSSFLDKCLGPDIVVQKNINLVIQKPNDKERSPFHKDAPTNSNYELVLWIPLVDCVKTMNMYVFEGGKHAISQKFVNKNNKTEDYEAFSKKEGVLNNVKFGQMLIFWTNNYHYIPVNKEKETRWSLNIRYKNLFTRYGTKNLLDFYEILKTSSITKLLDKIDV